MQTPSVIMERRLGLAGKARFTLRGLPANVTIPALDDEVTVTDVETSAVLWGGRVRQVRPQPRGSSAFLDVDVWCASHDLRLSERLIPPDDGVAIAKLDTLAAQVEDAIEVLSGEGFTHSVTLPAAANPVATDVRLLSVRAMLEDALELEDSIIRVSPTKEVTVESRSGATASGLAVDFSTVASVRRGGSTRGSRTKQYVRGGAGGALAGFRGRRVAAGV